MLGSLAAMSGWQGSAGQKVSVVGSLAVVQLKNFRCLAPWLPWIEVPNTPIGWFWGTSKILIIVETVVFFSVD